MAETKSQAANVPLGGPKCIQNGHTPLPSRGAPRLMAHGRDKIGSGYVASRQVGYSYWGGVKEQKQKSSKGGGGALGKGLN